MKYKVYNNHNFSNLKPIQSSLSKSDIRAIEVVGNVLPFKSNNYVINELIDWNNIYKDPIFQLTFPQKGMLSEQHFNKMELAMQTSSSIAEKKLAANNIRLQLNPNPAGQHKNVPILNSTKLTGVQHKYRETVLFFPNNSQTCHAYCTFCFRWPQFTGIDELKFAMKETSLLVQYLKENPEVTDILFTGGDPMVMSAKKFAQYTDSLIDADIPNLQNIRIGSKSLSYWPYRFISDKDSDDLLRQFEKIVKKGYHLSFMAHFNHPNELKTKAVQTAIKRILSTGANIRTQSPIMKHINNNANVWAEMWRKQVKLGCVPYYMFIARDTGAQDYFAVTLENAWSVFRRAYNQVSGIARTVRGPSMSAYPGKVQVLGISELNNQKVFVLRFVQGRNPNWVGKPFFAKYNPDAIWLTDLEPLDENGQFFFDKELKEIDILSN